MSARRLARLALVMGLGLLVPGFVFGQDSLVTTGPVVYELTERSNFQQGCFAPCLCPIMILEDMKGTFELVPAGFDGTFLDFEVKDVMFAAGAGDTALRISGSGKFRVSRDEDTGRRTQQLVLNLRVGDKEPQRFDSGLVSGEGLPRITLAVSGNGMVCFDTVLQIDAVPISSRLVRPFRLVRDSTFQEGCFDPCDCILSEERPLRGVFGLVRNTDVAEFREFKVVGIRWRARAPDLVDSVPITGSGVYRIFTELVTRQRLELDLKVGDDPVAHYDSGWVLGGESFPKIEITVSMNDMVCFDRVLRLRARPLGDFNGDGVVDRDDLNHLADCVAGPDAGGGIEGCDAFDFDFDGDIDLPDVSALQRAYEGG